MRTRVKTNEVPHLWAHQTQDNARNGRGYRNNLFFDGDTIYSYGNHFPIARHVQNKRKQKAILFTTRDYSNTTSKHKYLVRHAIPNGVPVFYVEDVRTEPDVTDIRYKEQKAVEYIAKAKRARTYKEGYLTSAQDMLNEAAALNTFFGIRAKVKTMDQLGVAANEILEARKQDALNKRKAEQARLKAVQEDLARWIAGERISAPWNLPYAFGRIENGELVTTKGASVPIAHISKVSLLVRSYITQGRTFRTNGHKIPLGVYQLSEIRADGTLIAGCHTFQKDEVIRILNLVDKFCLDVSTVGVFPTGV